MRPVIAHTARVRILIAALLASCSEDAAETPWVYDVRIGRLPALYWTEDVSALEHVAPELGRALRAAPPSGLPFEARVVLQNDVWALASRIEAIPMSSSAIEQLREDAVALARRLAVPRDRWPRAAWSIPRELGSGWREMGTELPVLSHERAFGLRRLFHLYHRGHERSLVGRIVALDEDGAAHLTGITSEIEVLELGPSGALSAGLYELDRGGPGERPLLREERSVSHVPGLSADSFFLELDPPEPIETLPCRRCHDDDSENSLPMADENPGARHSALLRQVRAPWRREPHPAESPPAR